MSADTQKSELHAPVYMRMAESVRLWQILCLFFVAIITVQMITIATLFPLKETRFRYVEFLNSNDVYYRIMPTADLSADQKELLVRKAIRKYVFDRNVKDDITEKQRAKIIRTMSDDAVWAQFKHQFSRMINTMDDVKRDIEIISDSIIDRGIHQVEFRAIDVGDRNTRVRNYIATLKYRIEPNPLVDTETDLLNPLGIKVLGYNVSERKIKGD